MDSQQSPVDKSEIKKLKNRIAVAKYKHRKQEFIEKLKKQLLKQIKECQVLKNQNEHLEKRNKFLLKLLEKHKIFLDEHDGVVDCFNTPCSTPEEMGIVIMNKAIKETIYANPIPKYLIGAENFNGIELTDFGVVAFRNIPNDDVPRKFFNTSPKDFTDVDNFIEKFYPMFPLRRISAEKIAFLYSFIIYTDEQQISTLRRLTFIAPNIMKEISINKIRYLFDDYLFTLYNKIPANSFYYVKSWVNLDFDHTLQDYVSYNFDYTFYSSYIMDINMTSIMYIFGKPIVVMQCSLSRTEASDGVSKYYIYQAKFPYDSSFLDELIRLKNEYGYKLVQKVLENQTRLIILTEHETNNPIFALARKSEYIPNFTGYQFCKVVE